MAGLAPVERGGGPVARGARDVGARASHADRCQVLRDERGDGEHIEQRAVGRLPEPGDIGLAKAHLRVQRNAPEHRGITRTNARLLRAIAQHVARAIIELDR